MKLSIVIPVYNEKRTLAEIVNKVLNVSLKNVQKEIILVNDASTDGSKQVVEDFANKHTEIKAIHHKRNQGKGASLKDGFKISTGDYVIVQDADLEYNPNDYSKLLGALENGIDVVYGSRFSGNYENMTSMHYIGNKILTVVTNILYGVLLTDMETCYKLIPGDFARSVKINSKKFDFEPEITAKILKSKMKIKEIPISYKGRSLSQGKTITWKDGIAAIFTLIRYRFTN